MSQIKVIRLTPIFVEKFIDSFISIAADIPNEDWGVDNYLHVLPDKWVYSIAAIDGFTNEMLGFIIGSQKDTHVHIHKFAVEPRSRSQKIGQRLLEHFEHSVKKNSQTKQVGLYVKNKNHRAIKFYEKNSYVYKKQDDYNFFYLKRLSFIIAIHQPNFFPWFGFFDKIKRADLFIYLDDAQFQKTGGTWTNRVGILDNNKSKWLTVSVNRDYSGTKRINEIIFNTRIDWKKDVRDVLTNAYRKAPFYKEVSEILFEQISCSNNKLVDFNINMNNTICDWLGLNKDKLIIASTFSLSSISNQRLIELVSLCNGNTYMCGGGAQGYQQDELFEQAGIEVIYQKFTPMPYNQFNSNEFIPGLSVIDAAMNMGIEKLAVFFNGHLS